MKFLRRHNPSRFNPQQYRSDAEQLAETNPASAAEAMTHWRTKFNMALNEGRKATEQAMEIGVAGIAAFGLGYADGRWEYNRKKIIDEYAAANPGLTAEQAATDAFAKTDKTDPTEFFGIPKTLWATVVLGGAAVFGLGGKNFNYLLRAGAVGFMATWSSGLGRDLGAKAAHDAATADADKTAGRYAA